MVDIQKMLDESLIRDQIGESNAGGEHEVKRGEYHVSSLTSSECLLRSLATRRIIMKDIEQGTTTLREEMLRSQVQMLRDMKRGNVIHEFFVDLYVREKGLGMVKEGFRNVKTFKSKLLPAREFTISGKYDLYDVQEDMIIELKSTRKFGFEGWKGVPGSKVQPKLFHMEQANAYANMIKVPNYKVVYIEDEGYVVAEHLGKVDIESFEKMVHRADLMFYSETVGQVHPEILDLAVEDWKCKGCPIAGTCDVEQETL